MVQGIIWAITALSLLIANVRFYIKWKYRGKLWYDDYILLGAAVSAPRYFPNSSVRS